ISSGKKIAVSMQTSPVTHIQHGVDAKKPLDIAAELGQFRCAQRRVQSRPCCVDVVLFRLIGYIHFKVFCPGCGTISKAVSSLCTSFFVSIVERRPDFPPCRGEPMTIKS